jgi:hypothetical protein
MERVKLTAAPVLSGGNFRLHSCIHLFKLVLESAKEPADNSAEDVYIGRR